MVVGEGVGAGAVWDHCEPFRCVVGSYTLIWMPPMSECTPSPFTMHSEITSQGGYLRDLDLTDH